MKGILDFYRNLYSKSLGSRHLPLNFEWNDVSPALTGQLSEGAIKTVIKMLGKSKASGPDGFTAEFLLKFWDLMKPNFLIATTIAQTQSAFIRRKANIGSIPNCQ